MAKKKNIVKTVSKALSAKAAEEAAFRQEAIKSSFRSRLVSLVPTPLRWLVPVVQNAEVEEEDQEVAVATPAQTANGYHVPHIVDPLYRQYRCGWGAPLSCEKPQQTVVQNPTAKYCLECGFPATLSEKTELQGRRGRYRIDSFLGRRGMGRLYQGIQLSDSQPVVIKEYLLPNRCFNAEESRQYQQAFERLAGVSLADGRVQDIRLISPWDAFADPIEERCYLVTQTDLDAYPTLGTYLALRGPMTGGQVRQVLNQVLQSLEFLHTQKFALPFGQIQRGVNHGNLSLQSLLIREEAREFFIYVCDLALWERLFDGPTAKPAIPSVEQDLVALGYVAFYLLAGTNVDPVSGQPLHPKDPQHWPASVHPPLKRFILRLLQLEAAFESAEEARLALLRLPPEPKTNGLVVQADSESDEKVKSRRPLFLFLWGLLGLLFLIWLVSFLLSKRQTAEFAQDDFLLCCINEVPAVPPGKFTYTAEKGGTWTYILKNANLVLKDKTLEQRLRERQPKLELNYRPELSAERAIAKVLSGEIDFAVTSLLSGPTAELQYQKVAYDGLVVFVAFSYAQREKSLPKALQGKITFENLRKLYTGEITNWQQIGGPDLPVRLYIPAETEAVTIFEQRVLKDKSLIASFRSLWKKENQPDSLIQTFREAEITPLPTSDALRQVIRDFEEGKAGGIAFGTLSKVFGQCSVYPLALAAENQTHVQALVQDSGQPIEPTTDLCDDKGSYHPNIQVFKDQSYPLGYSIAVVYPKDNSRPPVGAKFADMLRTHEAQRLLSKAGLIPLQPLSRQF